jgi:hypothetical protein
MADSRRYPLGNQLGKSVSTFLFIYFFILILDSFV